MGVVDWTEVNNAGAAAKKIYKAIDWASTQISSAVAAELDFGLVDFKKFDPSKLSDINDLGFDTLGKNAKKLDWSAIDYSQLNSTSVGKIDWTAVDFKEAFSASSFSLGDVDWSEVSTSSKTLKSLQKLFSTDRGQELLAEASADDLTGLDPSALLGTKYDAATVITSEADYTVVASLQNYTTARAAAFLLGGKLADFESTAESDALNNALFDEVTGLFPANPSFSRSFSRSVAKDGGGSSYLWIGGSDAAQEGTWLWDSPDSQANAAISLTRDEWGSGSLGSEPDNFNGLDANGQDALALGLANWPKGAATDQGYGNTGEWNDVSTLNKLGFIVELPVNE